ncbi:MAG TPA: glycosyltransferase family 2 protein [Gemmatimonadota bacterium]|nr:glycosyltransferase family 2 protein [Gemmatimonadota bacterium]
MDGGGADRTLSGDRVLALVPARDEAPRISAVVDGAGLHLAVVVVDDGSEDGTSDVARAAGAEVLRHPASRGKGEALRTGFRAALTGGADAVVTLDGDGQHDPAEIPAFLAAWRASGADLVVGARDFRSMPPSRRLANTLGRRVLRWAAGADIPDNQSGYRLVSRRLMEAMIEAGTEPGFGFEVEEIAVCLERGWRIEWVPIRTIYSEEESHIRAATHVARFLRLARRIRRARSRG